MKTQMKLLDCALISLLAGGMGLGTAYAHERATDCTGSGCRSEEGVLFQLRTRSDDEPVTRGTVPSSGAVLLAPDRRGQVALAQPGRAVASGKSSVDLPNGGAVWATEDPTLGQPALSISAPSIVAFDGSRVTRPVPFYVRSNYPRFIDRYELSIHRAEDVELIEPLARVPLEVAAVSTGEWDGELPDRYRYRAGDELVYVLRAYDSDGRFDETQPRQLRLVRPEEAERGAVGLRQRVEKRLGTAFTAEQALQQSLLDEVFAIDGLRQQNIPIHGSRIRIHGRNLPAGLSLKINGETYPVDMERKFVAEYLSPIGLSSFLIELEGKGEPIRSALDVEVTGRYLFGVGLADVTAYQHTVGGSVDASAANEPYADDVISDGRLAFYLKAKTQGRYLITAQADTTERDLQALFTGFTKADAMDIFRRLDPDLYYPVYGDDSNVYRDVDTMGRFYVRMDWDRNQALWGNFATGITGTEYAQYVRSLYGAALDWRSRASNAWGDPATLLRAFASQAQTAPGHSEFLGTGGSLYYLRHADVLPGSEQVVLEIRDLTTGRVEDAVSLQRGADYEINELQGRILLTRPLAQVTRENMPTITRDTPLDGYEQRLVVDYEWVPSGFGADDMTAGLRARHWFGNYVGVGVTQVNENRSGEDYSLSGADLTLRAGKGTFLKLERSRTESSSAPLFFSDNGGFTFQRIDGAGPRSGEATAVEGRVNLKELGWTTADWSAAAWWREVGAGYSISRYDTAADVTEYGTEVLGQVHRDLSLYSRVTRAERGSEALEQAQVTAQWRTGDFDALSAELRRTQENRATGNAAGTLGAVKYTRRVGTALDVYGIAQVTLDDDDGKYAANDAYTLGSRYLFGDSSTVGLETTQGDRGGSTQVDAEYRFNAQQSVYGRYTVLTDSTRYDALFNPQRQSGWTAGQKWRVSNQVNVFNESQYLKNPDESGLAHTFGMDVYPAQGWNLGFTLQDGELTNHDGGRVDRRALSVAGGHRSVVTEWQSKMEWRRDAGAERREQWVVTNRLTHRFSDSWRMAARLNWSDTDNQLDPAQGARFIEGNVGFAWRPWESTRWGIFGRYTYAYDLSTLGQINGTNVDQKTQVLALEGVYRIDQRWEVAAKVAQREGEVRLGRGAGPWFDASTTFMAGQLRYDLHQAWHGLAEYRTLRVKEGGTRQGWLVGLDRDVGKNLRVGAGYNFTDFSDKLTDFDYDHRGWYLNVVGTY